MTARQTFLNLPETERRRITDVAVEEFAAQGYAGAMERCIGEQRLTRGRIDQQAVKLVVTGPGIANTVHGLTIAITVKRPALILQTGCGGGFREAGLKTGDVAIASGEIDATLA